MKKHIIECCRSIRTGNCHNVYTSPMMKGGAVPDKFDIDISGVLNLKIEKSGTGIADNRWCCIYDAGFYA